MTASQLDSPVDYRALHFCLACETQHYLDVLPHPEGFIAGVRCACRDRTGGPRRYSVESGPFATYVQANRSRGALLRLSLSTELGAA